MANCRFKFEDSEAPEVLRFLQKGINIAASEGDVRVVKRLLEDGADANDKDIYGRTPLHYAANNGHTEIVEVLLENGADATQASNKGSTPLHTACYKGYSRIAKVLLQHVSRDKLNNFVDAKTTSKGNTSLHIAAEGGVLELVELLLENGATYDIENNEGNTPTHLSKDEVVTDFLKLLKACFEDVKSFGIDAISILNGFEPQEFFAIANTRNGQGKTLFQVAIDVTSRNISGRAVQSQTLRGRLDQLKRLKSAAEYHMKCFALLPHKLHNVTIGEENNDYEEAYCEIIEYLMWTRNLVETYEYCKLDVIDERNLLSVCTVVVALLHTGQEYETCSRQIFSMCTKLMISESRGYITQLLSMFELYVDIPVKMFLDSVEEKLQGHPDFMQ